MVTGIDELRRQLTVALPEAIEKSVKDAMAKAADSVVAEMKSRAPVYAGPPEIRTDKRHKGQPVRPGALRDSIAWTFGNAPKGTVALGSVKQKQFTREGSIKLTIYMGNKEAFYARWVEFGTREWLGNPFFFGVWRANKNKVRGAITRALRKAIKAEIQKSNGMLK